MAREVDLIGPPAPSRRSRRRKWLTVVILLVILAVIGSYLAWRLGGSNDFGPGDPGGHILAQLKTASAAVPSNATIDYAHYDEPHIDSCDGMAGTRGWTNVDVQIHFHWNGTSSALLAYVDHRLPGLGWSRTSWPSGVGPGGAWTKRLQSGIPVRLTVETENYGGWTLFTQAPPVGRQVSGC